METTILVILAVIGIVMAMLSVMKPIMEDNKIRGKVLNFDEGMRHYYFKLASDEAALRRSLASDEPKPLACRFDGTDLITFQKENVEAVYRLRFCEKEGQSWLSVSRVAEEREQGSIPYLVNAFFIKGFAAKPVDYRQAQAMFPEE